MFKLIASDHLTVIQLLFVKHAHLILLRLSTHLEIIRKPSLQEVLSLFISLLLKLLLLRLFEEVVKREELFFLITVFWSAGLLNTHLTWSCDPVEILSLFRTFIYALFKFLLPYLLLLGTVSHFRLDTLSKELLPFLQLCKCWVLIICLFIVFVEVLMKHWSLLPLSLWTC